MDKWLSYLQKLKAEGEIGLLEYQFAKFVYGVETRASQELISCAVLATHDQLNGNICTDLSKLNDSHLAVKLKLNSTSLQDLFSILDKSTSVGKPGDYTPFILEGDKLYLQKYWEYENELIQWLKEKTEVPHKSLEISDALQIMSMFESDEDEINLQMIGTALALLTDLVIISGGPGTGKTFTVKTILEVLINNQKDLKIALAAPTGKATERLSESIAESFGELKASTIHRLLGARKSGEFKYGQNNKLPYDVVIIDEASMLDIRLWISLIRAIKKSAKLILLGDKDQLASVEAGSVLGDICFGATNDFSAKLTSELKVLSKDLKLSNSKNILNDHIILLNKSYRSKSGSGISELAKAINDQNQQEVFELEKLFSGIEIIPPSSQRINSLIEDYKSEILADGVVSQFLCSNKIGELGTNSLNDEIERRIKKAQKISDNVEWYSGRKIIITKNNRALSLKNGEIGTCSVNDMGQYFIHFDSSKEISVSQLIDYDLAYAITVHKSQGSEFDKVVLFLPDKLNPVLTKELLYTGVTRARENALVVGERKLIEQVIVKSVIRASSIPDKLIE
ncbi:MAG: exodeoxyribonuclease V subunit alpha [Balneola sp.]